MILRGLYSAQKEYKDSDYEKFVDSILDNSINLIADNGMEERLKEVKTDLGYDIFAYMVAVLASAAKMESFSETEQDNDLNTQYFFDHPMLTI
ncbi:hypothetical protein [Spirochaeta cellobiosiphila]|uniref:hypothetical protein n=1 Tax=Spirochaeta cellobiosiphila TaxID=504483 RepID=UPI000408E41A|nr:hypothetical protein [Spirochaeta cellobiosiphila]